eukprot:10273050-Alexandrium_andersonii.AAC.1
MRRNQAHRANRPGPRVGIRQMSGTIPPIPALGTGGHCTKRGVPGAQRRNLAGPDFCRYPAFGQG